LTVGNNFSAESFTKNGYVILYNGLIIQWGWFEPAAESTNYSTIIYILSCLPYAFSISLHRNATNCILSTIIVDYSERSVNITTFRDGNILTIKQDCSGRLIIIGH